MAKHTAQYTARKIIERIDWILDRLDRMYLTNILEVKYFQISLHNDDNEVV